MIDETRTEEEYRALRLDSSSSLKEFSIDRKKYRKRFILGERVEEKDNPSANMGRIVETLLLEKDEFDNRFFQSSTIAAPTGLMLEFVEALYKYTSEATDEDGIVQADFEEIVEKAYKDSGFKIAQDAVLKKFTDSAAEIYYQEIRAIRPKNLTVITAQDINNAERIVEELKNNFVTSRIVNMESTDRFTVLNQFQIVGFEVHGHKFKGMLDKIIVDHKLKTIHPYDLKCVWSVEGFYEDYYLFRRAYIQAYLYHQGLCWLTQQEGHPFYGYSVNYLKFIICDSINYYNPLVYTVSAEDMLEACNGFEYKGRKYPGVIEIIKDLEWAVDNDIWNISRKNFEKKGVINIKE